MSQVGFSTTITKSLQPQDVPEEIKKKFDGTSDRFFEGIVTAEIVDTQNEITIRDELTKALPVWLKRGGAMSNEHSSQIVGKGLSYENVDIRDGSKLIPAIKIQGVIFSDNKVDDMVWNRIVNKEYQGFSFGGITRGAKEPVLHKDGTMSYKLKDLDVLEVAICKKPSCPLALITDYNKIAKSYTAKQMNDMNFEIRQKANGDDEVVVKCDQNICYVEKSVKLINEHVEGNDVMKSDEKDKKDEDEETEEENKSITSLQDSVNKLTDIVSKGMEKQTTFAEQVTKKFEAMEASLKEDDKDDDDEDDETKKAEQANELAMSNGKKNVKFPNDDKDANDDPAGDSATPTNDEITIEQKDAVDLERLMKTYPDLFQPNDLVEVTKSDEQYEEYMDNEDVNKTEELTDVAYTPRFTEITKEADEIIEKSEIQNEFAALAKSGGSPDVMAKIREKMKDGTFGEAVDTPQGLGVRF